MRIRWGENVYVGDDADEIVRRTKLDSFFVDPTVEDFQENVAYRAEIWTGEILHFTSSQEFLEELDRLGIIEILDDERAESVDAVETISSLFEGVCPKCGSDVRITHIGGTKEWLEQEGLQMGEKGTLYDAWTRSRDEIIGAVLFLCDGRGEGSTRHEFYLELTRHGEWAM